MFQRRGDDARSGRTETRKPRRGRVFWAEAPGPERLEGRTLLSLTFTTFSTPMVALVEPQGITKAADGNLWFAETGANRVGRVTPAGTLSEFPLPANLTSPRAFTVGPDGNLWFGAFEQPAPRDSGLTPVIARMTFEGTVTAFTLPSTTGGPGSLTSGPDGNLWFSDPRDDQIGRMTTSGVVTLFATPRVPAPAGSPPYSSDGKVVPGAITTGPDGALWFLSNRERVYRVTTGGSFTGFAVHGLKDSVSNDITTGPDGALWFTGLVGSVGRLTTGGVLTLFSGLGHDAGDRIANGPDGNLWVGDSQSSTVSRVTPKGAFTSFSVPGNYSTISGLTAGPDGNLWLTETEDGQTVGQKAAVLKVGTNGSVTPIPFPARTTRDPDLGVNLNPTDITVGPDGALWFTERQTIGRVTTRGKFTRFPLPTLGAQPNNIVTGPDGALWFTETVTGAHGKTTAAVGRITTAGAIRQYPIPSASSASTIVRGPDGNLWFLEGEADSSPSLARITPAGVITAVDVALPDTGYTGTGVALAKGPDGNVWFSAVGVVKPTGVYLDSVGRITARGEVKLFKIPQSGEYGSYPPPAPSDLLAGPDGKLWFDGTVNGVLGIGRVSIGGEFAPNLPVGSVAMLTRGPNHQVAFTDGYVEPGLSSPLLRATRSGVVVTADLNGHFNDPPGPVAFGGMTAGPDGNLWVTDGVSRIVRMSGLDTPAGGLDNRLRPKHAPDFSASDNKFTNVTSNPRPAFAGIARPGAHVTLFARRSGEARYFVIGRADASRFDGSWTLTSLRPLADGKYAVVAAQKGDRRPPSVLYSLEPDPAGTPPKALVVATPRVAGGSRARAAAVAPPHPAAGGATALRHTAPVDKTRP